MPGAAPVVPLNEQVPVDFPVRGSAGHPYDLPSSSPSARGISPVTNGHPSLP